MEAQDPPATPARHKPYTTVQVYGTLALIAVGILVMAVSCAATWLYYVQVRSDR